MSIHNFKEVEEGEAHESRNKTRDRFGKEHPLTEQDGSPRISRRRTKIAVLVFAFLAALALPVFADENKYIDPSLTPPLEAPVKPMTSPRSTDLRVESEDTANDWLNAKYNEPSDDFGIPIDGNTTVGFNEDGDPSAVTRF